LAQHPEIDEIDIWQTPLPEEWIPFIKKWAQ